MIFIFIFFQRDTRLRCSDDYVLCNRTNVEHEFMVCERRFIVKQDRIKSEKIMDDKQRKRELTILKLIVIVVADCRFRHTETHTDQGKMTLISH